MVFLQKKFLVCDDDEVMDVFYVMQADNRQENIVVADIKKLETDGLVNFMRTNQVRYITEYDQVVGPQQDYYHYMFCLSFSFSSLV